MNTHTHTTKKTETPQGAAQVLPTPQQKDNPNKTSGIIHTILIYIIRIIIHDDSDDQ